LERGGERYIQEGVRWVNDSFAYALFIQHWDGVLQEKLFSKRHRSLRYGSIAEELT